MEFNFDDFDAILMFDQNSINEDSSIRKIIGNDQVDTRASSVAYGPYTDKGAYSQYIDYIDPKLYASWSFGKQMRDLLGNVGQGYGCEVADYGKYVSVKVTFSNPPTGKSTSKTFLVVFDSDGKKGNIFQTSNRYRTFSGISQAASYIKSCASSLKNATN